MIFVCSPYSGDIKRNTEKAKEYCRYVLHESLETPFAPHLYFPQFLNEQNPADRELGITLGLEIMSMCSEVWVFGNLSQGMEIEINHARKIGKPVKYPLERLMKNNCCADCHHAELMEIYDHYYWGCNMSYCYRAAEREYE